MPNQRRVGIPEDNAPGIVIDGGDGPIDLNTPIGVRVNGVDLSSGGGAHPNLAAHDTLGLATQAELDAVAAAAAHPNLAAHDTLGLATQAELDAIAAAKADTGHTHSGATVSQQAANYTLALADAGTEVEGTKATAQTITVPPNADVAFPVGTVVNIRQYGAGQITITPGAGVTLRSPAGLKTRAQYSTASLIQRAANEWVVGGDTAT